MSSSAEEALEDQPTKQGTVQTGALWMLLARFAETGLGVVNTAILARLLSPNDFGLMALSTSVMAGIEVLGAFGFDWALVRQPKLTRSHLDTAWTLRVIIGLMSLLGLAALAVPVAHYYNETRMTLILPILGTALFFTCCENPGVVIFRRNFNFAKEFGLRTVPKIVAMCLSIPIAIFTRSWLALLSAILIGRLASTIFSYFMQGHRPRFSLAASAELLSFSVWLSLNNVVDFLRWRLSTFIVGKYLGTRSVGLFSVSMDLANLATTELAAPINRAVFSKYAQFGSDREAVGKGFLLAGPAIWMLALPIASGIGLTAPQLIYLLLGPKWMDGTVVLQLMAIAGALHVMSANTAYVYWALGRSKVVSLVTMTGVCVLIPATVILIKTHQLTGVAYAHILATSVMLPINYVMLIRILKIRYRDFLRQIWRCLAACALMTIVVSVLGRGWQLLSVKDAILQLMVLASTGAFVYISTIWLFWQVAGRPLGAEKLMIDTCMGFIQKRAHDKQDRSSQA